MDATYGNWSDDWIMFLVGATFAISTLVLLTAFYMVWAIKALRS